MASLTPVSLFVAATSLLITPGLSVVAHAEDKGGLLEWNTDQSIDAESRPDADAAAIQNRLSRRMFVYLLEKVRIAGNFHYSL